MLICLVHVKALEELSAKEAFVVANEIFDAFACEVIKEDHYLCVGNHKAFFYTYGYDDG